VTIESNFYAEGSGASLSMSSHMSFIDWQNSIVRARIAGFTWLPRMLQSGGCGAGVLAHRRGFRLAPERYDPNRSFQLAAARYLGVPDEVPLTNGLDIGPR